MNIKINSPIGYLFAYNFFFFFKEPPKSSKSKIHHIVFEFSELMVHILNAPHLLCFSKKKKKNLALRVTCKKHFVIYYWDMGCIMQEELCACNPCTTSFLLMIMNFTCRKD